MAAGHRVRGCPGVGAVSCVWRCVALCGCPFVLPSSRCVNARSCCKAKRRCNSGSLPLGCPAPSRLPPRGEWSHHSPRSGPVRQLRRFFGCPEGLPACGSRRESWAAMMVAVVDAVPGDLKGARAGAHGCKVPLVSLRASSSSCLPLTTAILGNRANISSARTLCKTAPPLTRFALSNQPECCQLCCQPSRHCSQRWTYEQSKT